MFIYLYRIVCDKYMRACVANNVRIYEGDTVTHATGVVVNISLCQEDTGRYVESVLSSP